MLEVMAKQQNEAQTAATAAMAAQNEALRNFQDIIASIVVPLSQRPPTAVHLPEKDEKDVTAQKQFGKPEAQLDF